MIGIESEGFGDTAMLHSDHGQPEAAGGALMVWCSPMRPALHCHLSWGRLDQYRNDYIRNGNLAGS